jgi:hypothetical protein
MSESSMPCPSCGKETAEGAAFCIGCGSALSRREGTAATEPAQAAVPRKSVGAVGWWNRQSKVVKVVTVVGALAVIGAIIGAAQGGDSGSAKGVAATTTTRSTMAAEPAATEVPTTEVPTTEVPTTEVPTTEVPALPDWNEQAALKAHDYLEYSSFSRTGLIEQLIFEGFTRDQAQYGANAVGY